MITITPELELLMRRLNAYIAAGGMLCEPTGGDETWEMGRNLGPAYCIDGQGDTVLSSLMSVSEEVWKEIEMP